MSEDGQDDAGVQGPDAPEVEVIDELITYLQFQRCPAPWLEAVEGRRSIEDASSAAASAGDGPALVEQSEVLFSPQSALERARLRRDLIARYGHASTSAWKPLVLVAVSIAAVIGLVLSWPSGTAERVPSRDVDGASLVALTISYSVDVGGQASVRSAAEADVEIEQLYEGIPFDIVADPDEAVGHAVELRLFAQQEERAPVRLDPQIRNFPTGRMSIRSTPESLGLTEGRWELIIAVGSRGSFGEDPSDSFDPRAKVEGIQVFSQRVDVHAEPGSTTARIETFGCVAAGPWECIVKPGTPLRMWIGDPRARTPAVRVNGQLVDAERYGLAATGLEAEEDGVAAMGTGVQILIPERESEDFRRLSAASPAGPQWVVTVGSSDTGAKPMLLVHVGSIADLGGDIPRIQENVLDHVHQAREAWIRDQWSEALSHNLEAMRLARDHELWTLALRAGASASHILAFRLERPDEAQRVLNELTSIVGHAPQQRAQVRFERGIQSQRQGKMTVAAGHLLEATRFALTLQDEGLLTGALPMFIRTLIDLGHYEQAHRWSKAAVEMSRDYQPCRRANILRNVGDYAFRLAQQGEAHLDPGPLLREALELFQSAEDCSAWHEQVTVLSALALFEVSTGALAQAERHLQGLDAAELTGLQRLWVAEARLGITLAQEPERARERLASLEAAAGLHPAPEARWRLAMAQAAVEMAANDTQEAIEAYGRAEDELDQMVRLWALGAHHDLFTAQRAASAQGLVRLLVIDEQWDQALFAARRARARSLWAAVPSGLDGEAQARLDELRVRHAEQRGAYDHYARMMSTLPRTHREREYRRLEARRDALNADLQQQLEQQGIEGEAPHPDRMRGPAPREVILTIVPVGGDDWAVFAADRHTVEGRLLEDRSAREASAAMLASFSRQIERAEEVRVVAAGRAHDVAVHMLPWNGRPLMASASVVYAADLPDDESDRPVRSPTRAVLLEDPTGSLRVATGPELADAQALLESRGWIVDRLGADGAAVSQQRTVDALASADLFHFAGHGSVEPSVMPGWPSLSGGAPGWSTHLEFGGGSRLDVHGILGLSKAPAIVVLSGCYTGVVDPRSPAGGMSMAMAFLLAGSERVVSSTEEIDNDDARKAVGEMYRSGALMGAGMVELEAAPAEAWTKLRVWVR